MVFAPLLHALTALLNSLFASLPTFDFVLGTGGDGAGFGGADKGGFVAFLPYFGQLDRFIPIHDALIPIIGIQLSIAGALLVFKAVKFVISCIPTISAGG